MLMRPRRNRKSPAVRAMMQETRLHPTDFIYPLFVREGKNVQEPIKSLPGVYRLSPDLILKQIEEAVALHIPAIALFPVIEAAQKDERGSYALRPDGILIPTIELIKREFPDVCLIADIALDPYTSHGHDGLVKDGDVDNDTTVEVLAEMSVILARAGIDMVAPSDMMDGRVLAIRKALDKNDFSHVSVHAYTAKYASAFYGPFRDALSSQLSFGDKKSYQMNPANAREAIREAHLDLAEGADIIMVKPALPYLDIIARIKQEVALPISAYQVSGEYAMLKAADRLGWLDGKRALLESLIGIKRAGADMIFTYGAIEAAAAIKDGALG